MKILALVASQDSTVEDVKTNGRRQMQALIGKDKEVLFCEYSTIEICRNGELAITCLGEKMEKPDYFWPLLGSTDGFILENMLQDAGISRRSRRPQTANPPLRFSGKHSARIGRTRLRSSHTPVSRCRKIRAELINQIHLIKAYPKKTALSTQ